MGDDIKIKRSEKILELRRRGLPWRVIGKEVGCTKERARQDFIKTTKRNWYEAARKIAWELCKVSNCDGTEAWPCQEHALASMNHLDSLIPFPGRRER